MSEALFGCSLDLGDLDLGERLAVSVAARVAGLGFVLHDIELFAAAVSDDFSRNLSGQGWSTELELVAFGLHKGLQLEGLSFFDVQFLNGNHIAFLDEVLLSPGFDDSNHRCGMAQTIAKK